MIVDSKNLDDDSAAARKRRIERRAKARASEDASFGDEPELKRCRMDSSAQQSESEYDNEAELARVGKPSIRGIKRQARYEPGVPMTKDELAQWRKEARRVRNRESAAASRKKTRERITELEGQVETLQTKYLAALQRIIELENDRSTQSRLSDCIHEDIVEAKITNSVSTVSPPSSDAEASPETSAVVPESRHTPRDCFSLDTTTCKSYPNTINMISRPTAVKINNGVCDDGQVTEHEAPIASSDSSECTTTSDAPSDLTTGSFDTSNETSDTSHAGNLAGGIGAELHDDDVDLGAFLWDALAETSSQAVELDTFCE